MYANPEIYSKYNLDVADRRMVSAIEEVADNVLNKETVTDYLDEKEVNGYLTRGVFEEQLTEFVKYLRSRAGYYKEEVIMSLIDRYTDKEFEEIIKNRKENG